MARFMYEYMVYDNYSETYCSTTHQESLVLSEKRLYSTVRWALIWLVKIVFGSQALAKKLIEMNPHWLSDIGHISRESCKSD